MGEEEIRKLDLGCGQAKMPGSIGVDRIPLPGVDVLYDLNLFPYPFPHASFDYIRLWHVVEHLDSIVQTIEEVYRLARPGAVIDIVTPHFTDVSSWQDPTHYWHLSTRSFDLFGGDLEISYYVNGRMVVEHSEIKLLKLYKYLGIEWLVNLENRHRRLRFFRRFWETYISFVIRGKVMHFRLRVIKDSVATDGRASPGERPAHD
jgi:SAM-dependent methyltransferase